MGYVGPIKAEWLFSKTFISSKIVVDNTFSENMSHYGTETAILSKNMLNNVCEKHKIYFMTLPVVFDILFFHKNLENIFRIFEKKFLGHVHMAEHF